MAHKVHPKIFRIKETQNWDSRWLTKKKFPQYLKEDFEIREFFKKKLKEAGLEKIEIERFPGKTNIIIETTRPGLIIGRGGKEIEELKKELERKIFKGEFPSTKIKEKRELRLEIKEIKTPWIKAHLSAQWIASQIEKRVRYRRVLKQALDKIMAQKEIKGARVEVSGRLDGTEIARREWLKKGQLPRQTIRADIDYGQAEAFCTYGVVGVKVWIYKGEKF